MPNAKDIAAINPETSILVVGDSGTHKTFFLGTIPEVFIFDFDKGMAINRGKDVEYETFKDAPYGSNATSKKHGIYPWGTAWPAFVRHLNKIGEAIDKDEWGDRPIALDSLTTLMNLAMNHVLKEAGRKPSDGIRIQDWGQQIGLVETILDQLTAWPVMVVATAHVSRDTNQMMETVEMLPLLTGKFAGRVGIYFDEVWYTKVSGKGANRDFAFQTESSGMVKQAKTRYNVPDGTAVTWEAVSSYLTGVSS